MIEIVIIMISSLKTGRAYVSIDVTFPESRVESIVSETKSEMVYSFSSLKQIRVGKLVPIILFILMTNITMNILAHFWKSHI